MASRVKFQKPLTPTVFQSSIQRPYYEFNSAPKRYKIKSYLRILYVYHRTKFVFPPPSDSRNLQKIPMCRFRRNNACQKGSKTGIIVENVQAREGHFEIFHNERSKKLCRERSFHDLPYQNPQPHEVMLYCRRVIANGSRG